MRWVSHLAVALTAGYLTGTWMLRNLDIQAWLHPPDRWDHEGGPMPSDPHDPNLPFNRLCDIADVRTLKVGLRAGSQLHKRGHGDEWRDIDAVELTTPTATWVERVYTGNVQDAARRLLVRIAGPAAV